MSSSLPTRPLGRTNVQVTILGTGTAPIGGNSEHVARADAMNALQASHDAGVRYFDTAPFYGYGKAEHRTGDFLRGLDRDSVVLSTKVGRILKPRFTAQEASDKWVRPLPFTPVFDYGYDGVMRSFDHSIQRLGLNRIDILLVHDIARDWHPDPEQLAKHFKDAMDGGQRALAELKGNGHIGAYGLGVNERDVCNDALGHGDWDCFLLAGRYTLLEQDPLDDLLPACVERGTSIITGGPYNSGLLAGRDTWNYAPAPQDKRERARRLGEVCASHGVDLKAAALQFPLAHPAVATMIPGAVNAAETAENARQITAAIPDGLWSDLQAEGLIRADAPTPKAA